MGVEEEPEMVGSSSQVERDEELVLDSLASLEIEMDTIVLPEGVCLFDKPFVITEKDPDGKKFDKGKTSGKHLCTKMVVLQFHVSFAVVQALHWSY